MKIRQIRNATLRINFGGVEFLTDPWLAGKTEGMTFRKGPFAAEVVDPAQLDIVMPMCELPLPLAEVLSGVDAYVLTHLHPDHFDMAADGTAGAKLDKAVPLFVQNEDEVAVMKCSGFKFGGSTVIFAAKAGAVRFDDDIVRNSSGGLETRVLCCEKIASPAPKTLRAAGEALAKD